MQISDLVTRYVYFWNLSVNKSYENCDFFEKKKLHSGTIFQFQTFSICVAQSTKNKQNIHKNIKICKYHSPHR